MPVAATSVEPLLEGPTPPSATSLALALNVELDAERWWICCWRAFELEDEMVDLPAEKLRSRWRSCSGSVDGRTFGGEIGIDTRSGSVSDRDGCRIC